MVKYYKKYKDTILLIMVVAGCCFSASAAYDQHQTELSLASCEAYVLAIETAGE